MREACVPLLRALSVAVHLRMRSTSFGIALRGTQYMRTIYQASKTLLHTYQANPPRLMASMSMVLRIGTGDAPRVH